MLKASKNHKVFALILLTSMLLMIAVPNIQPVKAATTYTVSIWTSCAGTTSPDGSSTAELATYTYNAGSTQTFTATADTGFKFLCWVIVGNVGGTTSTDTTLTYTVTQSTAIQAIFIPTSSTVTLPTAPTPTINEFSSATVIILAIALVAVTLGTYAYTKRAKK